MKTCSGYSPMVSRAEYPGLFFSGRYNFLSSTILYLPIISNIYKSIINLSSSIVCHLSIFPSFYLVLCPPCVRLPVRNGLVNEVEFLGLIHQNGGRPMRLRDR